MISAPMLAGKIKDLSQLRFPLIASPKIDGIRCLVVDGQALTRSFKPVPNRYVASLVAKMPNGLDGELLIPGAFQNTTSGIMSREGKPEFTYNLFDHVRKLDEPFEARVDRVLKWVAKRHYDYPFLRAVAHVWIDDASQLKYWEDKWLTEGYEGVMIRDPKGPYKCGRSTWREGWLLKLKRFTDDEAIVVDVLELQHNANDAYEGELGQTKRSSSKAGKIPGDTLGKLVVRTKTGVEFRIGVFNGLKAADKKALWDNRASLIGKLVKFRYQEAGTKDRPRIPVFLGWRDERDL